MSEDQGPSVATDEAPESQDGLKIWSCVNCRRRKLRCERSHPCANCVRSKMDCHFPVTGRLPRRSRQPVSAANSAQKQSELLGRLRRLEAVVTELTGQMETGAGEATTSEATQDTSAIWQRHDDPIEDFGNLVTDANGSLRVAKGFWSIFCTEVDSIFQAVANVGDAPEEQGVTSDDGPSVTGSIRSQHQSFVMGDPLPGRVQGDVSLSPLPSQMLFLWQIFCDNVDPFIKVLDLVAMAKTIQGIKESIDTLPSESEALMFSMSLAAIVSLDEEEVVLNFGVPKPQLSARLRLGAEKALANAEFMTTRSLVVAQAFVIYTTVLPQLGAMQLAAPMTAILVRVALSMGLHRDPCATEGGRCSISFEEVETRRRLWWHVCFLDARVKHKDVPELSISQSTATTQEPVNIEDGLSGIRTFTSVTFCRIRCELWRLSHDIRKAAENRLESQKQHLSDARTHIQQAYFFDQDVTKNTFQIFTYHLVQLFFSQIDYNIHRRQTSNADRAAHTLLTAGNLMDTTHALITRTEWKAWRWQLEGHAPWSAMLSTLRLLSRNRWTSEAHRAWTALQRLVDAMPSEAQDLRVLQAVKRRVEDIRGPEQCHGFIKSATAKAEHATNSQGSVLPEKISNLQRGHLADSESPIDCAVEDSPFLSSFLQESWDLPDVQQDTEFQWESLPEIEDTMDWQVLDGCSDTSLFWGLHPV